MQQNWRQRENHLPAFLSHLLLPPPSAPPRPSLGFSFGCRGQAAEVRKWIRSGSREIAGRHRVHIVFCWLMSPCFLAAPPASSDCSGIFAICSKVVLLARLTLVLHRRSPVVLGFFYFEGPFIPRLLNFLPLNMPHPSPGAKHLCLFSLHTRECLSRCAACAQRDDFASWALLSCHPAEMRGSVLQAVVLYFDNLAPVTHLSLCKWMPPLFTLWEYKAHRHPGQHCKVSNNLWEWGW